MINRKTKEAMITFEKRIKVSQGEFHSVFL